MTDADPLKQRQPIAVRLVLLELDESTSGFKHRQHTLSQVVAHLGSNAVPVVWTAVSVGLVDFLQLLQRPHLGGIQLSRHHIASCRSDPRAR